MQSFEARLQALEPSVEQGQHMYQQLLPAQRSRALETRLAGVLELWESLWARSHLYVDRLKGAESVFAALEDLGRMLSEYEREMASHSTASSNTAQLKRTKGDVQVIDYFFLVYYSTFVYTFTVSVRS